MNGISYYPSQNPIVKLRQEMKLRGFSQKTISNYLHYTIGMLKKARKGPRAVNVVDVRSYLENLVDVGRSASTLNSAYSALQFYFEKILHRRFFVHIPRAKKEKKLPEVLTKEEVKRILGAINNVKHLELRNVILSGAKNPDLNGILRYRSDPALSLPRDESVS